MTAGLAAGFSEGVEAAEDVIASGEGGRLLDRFVEATNG